MPYKSIRTLPDQVKNVLPKHAQAIYKSSYNNAYDQHKTERDTEEIAHRIAWSAVKKKYKKDSNGGWSKKEES